jgi:hypothetical protein
MQLPSDEDLWNLLDVFNGIGFVFALIFVLIWIRLAFVMLEDALPRSRSSAREFGHSLVETDGSPVGDLGTGTEDTEPSVRSSGLTLGARKTG